MCTLDENWTSPFLSGVGKRRHFGGDIVPNPLRNDGPVVADCEDENLEEFLPIEDEISEFFRIDLSLNSFGSPLMGHDGIRVGARISGFPFHSACWDLFRAVRGTENLSDDEVQALFDVLRSFPRHQLVDLGHDYGGIAGYDLETNLFNLKYSPPHLDRLMPGEEPRVVYNLVPDSLLLEMQQQNPMEIRDLGLVFDIDGPSQLSSDPTQEAYALSGYKETSNEWPADEECATLRSTTNPKKSFLAQVNATGGTDIFSKLPVEIRGAILCELSSHDVVSLKQSSRTFLYTSFSDVFWRTRFRPDREFGHLFESPRHFNDCRGRWNTIYHHFKSISRRPSLVNRQRTWTLARNMDALLGMRLHNRQCLGTPVASFFEPAPGNLEDDGAWLEANRCLRTFKKSFSSGSRALFERVGSLQQDDLDGIYISKVEVLGKTYVCGMRFQHSKGPSLELGYVRSETETLCTWKTGTLPKQVVGFHLAQGQRGLRGLAIVSSIDGMSDWVGEHHGDIPIRKLVLPQCQNAASTPLTMIKGGFDVSIVWNLSTRSSADSH